MMKTLARYATISIFILLNVNFSTVTFAKDFTAKGSNDKVTVTLDQIKKNVQQYEQGKIIAIASPKNKNYFLVSVLKKSGEVKSIMVDKKTAEILK